jgi:hypothetical protein
VLPGGIDVRAAAAARGVGFNQRTDDLLQGVALRLTVRQGAHPGEGLGWTLIGECAGDHANGVTLGLPRWQGRSEECGHLRILVGDGADDALDHPVAFGGGRQRFDEFEGRLRILTSQLPGDLAQGLGALRTFQTIGLSQSGAWIGLGPLGQNLVECLRLDAAGGKRRHLGKGGGRVGLGPLGDGGAQGLVARTPGGELRQLGDGAGGVGLRQLVGDGLQGLSPRLVFR